MRTLCIRTRVIATTTTSATGALATAHKHGRQLEGLTRDSSAFTNQRSRRAGPGLGSAVLLLGDEREEQQSAADGPAGDEAAVRRSDRGVPLRSRVLDRWVNLTDAVSQIGVAQEGVNKLF
jgi:hypothetical protein